jgi:hypothetical protein
MEPLPSIREVCASVAAFERRVLSDAQVSAEDLNDMKCAWYVAASGVPEGVLTDRERMFLKRYRAEGLRFSNHWNLKPEVTALLEEKRREFLSRAAQSDNK